MESNHRTNQKCIFHFLLETNVIRSVVSVFFSSTSNFIWTKLLSQFGILISSHQMILHICTQNYILYTIYRCGESSEIRIAHFLYDLFIFVSFIISFFLLLLLLSPSNIVCGNNHFCQFSWNTWKFQPELRGWTVSSTHFTETNQQIFNYIDWFERQNAHQQKTNQFESNFSVLNINLAIFFFKKKCEMFVKRVFSKFSQRKSWRKFMGYVCVHKWTSKCCKWLFVKSSIFSTNDPCNHVYFLCQTKYINWN